MIKAKKHFGQNFLIHQGIIAQIMATIAVQPGQQMVEIGPGHGALTTQLLKHCDSLHVIEIDKDLIQPWQENPKVHCHLADVLTFDFESLLKKQRKLRLVGNLPYNISTPLIIKLLKIYNHIDDMHFMLQKEVVERLAAKPNTKSYGRLSVISQYFCDIEPLLFVPPHAFIPQPKVDSMVVRLKPRAATTPLTAPLALFKQVVQQAFNQRRKTIANSLKTLITQEQLTQFELAPNLRAENLTIDDYVKISNLIKSKKCCKFSSPKLLF